MGVSGLGDALRAARIAAGLSQVEAARQMGISHGAWSAYERGLVHRIPDMAWDVVELPRRCGDASAVAPNRALAAARLDAGKSVTDCAAELGVSLSAWGAWESGVTAAPREAYLSLGVRPPAGTRALGEKSPRRDECRVRESTAFRGAAVEAWRQTQRAARQGRQAEAKALQAAGLDASQIAERLGVSRSAVYTYLADT